MADEIPRAVLTSEYGNAPDQQTLALVGAEKAGTVARRPIAPVAGRLATVDRGLVGRFLLHQAFLL